MILDNVDDARFLLEPPASAQQVTSAGQASLHKDRHMDYLPAANHGSILVTSRNHLVAKKMVDKSQIIPVGPMSD